MGTSLDVSATPWSGSDAQHTAKKNQDSKDKKKEEKIKTEGESGWLSSSVFTPSARPAPRAG